MDTVFLALRVVVALGAVFGALLLAHRWITKGRPGAAPRNRQISVVARQGLGQKAGIAVVDAGGRRYLLGVTEHAVTVLDTLGPAESPTGEPSLVASQPIAVARFEQELRTVTIATADVPVMVHGGVDPQHPGGPITQTVAIMPAKGMPVGGPRTASISFTHTPQPQPVQHTPVQHTAVESRTLSLRDLVASEPSDADEAPVYLSRRALREAEQAAVRTGEQQRVVASPVAGAEAPKPAQGGPLAGSVLSPNTWKQTFDALKKLR